MNCYEKVRSVTSVAIKLIIELPSHCIPSLSLSFLLPYICITLLSVYILYTKWKYMWLCALISDMWLRLTACESSGSWYANSIFLLYIAYSLCTEKKKKLIVTTVPEGWQTHCNCFQNQSRVRNHLTYDSYSPTTRLS